MSRLDRRVYLTVQKAVVKRDKIDREIGMFVNPGLADMQVRIVYFQLGAATLDTERVSTGIAVQ